MILNLLDRMKLPFRKNKEFLTALYDILGFYPHNIEIYRIAFAHKSLSYRRDSNSKDHKGRDRKPRSENTSKPLNNERLEYLGDAVLETVVSDILFRHFEHKREGFLTSTRSKIVQREALNRLASEMGLEKLIQAAQGTRVDHTNIGGNAFEALMGAIYLDRGFHHCHWFISNRIIGHYIDLETVAQKEVNFKSKLLEWSQKNRIDTKFKDTANENDEKGFESVIIMETITIGRGEGRSKKESQQAAAKEALTRMRREPKVYDSIFRAKEKRTAMEAEESFALPKIDEIENSIHHHTGNKGGKKNANYPVLEGKEEAQKLSSSDAAYNLAYDEDAEYEVIDTAPEEPIRTAADYEAAGLPAPPEENELTPAEDRAQKRRNRNRTPKTVNDAVKGFKENKNKPKTEEPTTANAEKEKNQKPSQEGNAAKADNRKKTPKERKQPAAPKKAEESSVAPATEPVVDETPLQTLRATVILDEEEPKKEVLTPAIEISAVETKPVKPETEEVAPETEETAVPQPEAEPEKGINPLETPEQPEEKADSAEPAADFIVTQDLVALEKETSETTPEEQEALEEENPMETADFSEEEDQQPEVSTAAEASASDAESDLPEKVNEAAPSAEEWEAPENEAAEAEEEEEAESEIEDAETSEGTDDKSAEPTLNESETRPQLRHLTLDDFVFGMSDHEAPASDEEDIEPTVQKSKRPRRRRRKPASSAPNDKVQEQKPEQKKADSEKKTQPRNKKEKPVQARKDANEGEASQPKPKRRRRRPAAKKEE